MKTWRGEFLARVFRWALFLAVALYLRDTCADVLYVSEFYQGRISKVDTSNGSVSPFVTGLNNPEGLGFDHAGNLFVAMQSQGVIDKISPSGAVTTFASGLNYYLGGLTVDVSGNVYVGANRYAGTFVSAILKFNSSGALLNTWTYNFAPTQPTGLAFDQGGSLWVSDYSGNGLYQVSPSGSATLVTSMSVNPMGVAVDARGNVFVANRSSGTVAEVAAGGGVTTFVSGLDNPAGLAFDSAGNLYAANSPNGGDGTTLTRITPDGTSSIFATGLDEPVFIANQTLAVPEPQSFALLGLATVLFRRRMILRWVPRTRSLNQNCSRL